MIIACLHTADSNIPIFDAARPAEVTLRHEVRADLLAAVGERLSLGVTARTQSALRQLAEDADAVLLTCSTLGPAAEGVEVAVPVLRVDQALAREACAGGGRVAVICAAPSTLGPTRDIFEWEAQRAGAEVRIVLVDGAWATFLSGDLDGYVHAIAGAANLAAADVVALARILPRGGATTRAIRWRNSEWFWRLRFSQRPRLRRRTSRSPSPNFPRFRRRSFATPSC